MLASNAAKLFSKTPIVSECVATFSCHYIHTLDKSKIPQILESDLEEQYMRGHGPGGQNVNKTNNCVQLKHLPTGIIVKCHHTRSQEQNRTIARQLLLEKLDEHMNGEMSISAQLKRIEEEKSKKKAQKAAKLREMKKEFKTREGIA